MSIKQNGSTIILENEFLRRVIDIEQGIYTKSYHVRPGGEKLKHIWYPVFSFDQGVPFEAAVTIDGQSYEAGPFAWGASGDLWKKEGAFKVEEVLIGKGKLGDTAEFVLSNRIEGIPQVALHIQYEVCDDLPVISKRIKVVNKAEVPIVIENMAVDILRFFDRKLPLYTFTNYYWDTKKEDPYYMAWTRIEFPEEIGVVLGPHEEMTSFDLYEVCTSMDRQEESVILHRVYKRLAPWIKNLSPELDINSCQTIEELYDVADVAVESGFELICLSVSQLFGNIGDYIPRKDLFPKGYEDVKKLVRYYHDKGLKVVPYASTTIAWRSSEVCKNHPDWQYLGPQGIRYSPESFGNMCYQSPWGNYIREKLFYLIDEIGFDGLALDGPYHGLTCLDTEHRHKTKESVKFLNWCWEKAFFGDVVAKGKIIKVPQVWNAELLGVCKVPGGYREEDQNEFGGMPLITMTRACLYESRYSTPACATWTTFMLEPWHGHSFELTEENTATYVHAMGSLYGYGHDGGVLAARPYVGEKTRAIYHEWIQWFKRYKETLQGEFIHLAQPNGYDADGIMHVNPDAATPALMVLFNPTEVTKKVFHLLPLSYAGFCEGEMAVIDGKNTSLDSRANAIYETVLAPYEVRTIPITKG